MNRRVDKNAENQGRRVPLKKRKVVVALSSSSAEPPATTDNDGVKTAPKKKQQCVRKEGINWKEDPRVHTDEFPTDDVEAKDMWYSVRFRSTSSRIGSMSQALSL